MVATALLLVAFAAGPSSNPAEPPASDPREFRVRTLEPKVREWLRTGAARSKTFAELLDRLATSDLIVYVTTVPRIPSGVMGQLSFVATKGKVRYLRIELVEDDSPREMIALLGHELQHAVEIAGAPRVIDSQSMASFYLHTGGLQNDGSKYDSVAARLAGNRVRAEISSFRAAARVITGEGEKGRETNR
jgi:hypothetical protein